MFFVIFMMDTALQVESLYPEEMGPAVMSVHEFMSTGLSLLDNNIQERVQKASLHGNVLRYVCVLEGARYFNDFHIITFSNTIDNFTSSAGAKSVFKSFLGVLLWEG